MSGEPSDSTVIQMISIVVLLALSAFFSSAETSMTAISKMRVRTLAEAGDKKAITLAKILEDQGKMLSAILIGNNIVNLTASAMTTALAISLFNNKAVAVGTGIITLLILVFGEITPKTVASLRPEMAYQYATIIYWLMVLCTPVIWIVNRLSLGVLLLFRIDPKQKVESITEDELRTIVEVSHEEGVIESEEKKMINNVFDFGDSVVKDVMVPRVDAFIIDIDASYEELIEVYRESMFTRIPVYEDTTDNVVGIINMKDLILWDRVGEFSIRDFLRKPLYTYEFKNTAELLIEMRMTMNNIVIVLDEYGAMAGLLTLEDLLEEIVGEIRDEYDADEENEICEIGEGEYMIEGSVKLADLNNRLDLNLESEECDSIGGLIICQLDHLPQEGEFVVCGNLRLAVEKVDKNRIDKVHLSVLKEEEGEAEV